MNPLKVFEYSLGFSQKNKDNADKSHAGRKQLNRLDYWMTEVTLITFDLDDWNDLNMTKQWLKLTIIDLNLPELTKWMKWQMSMTVRTWIHLHWLEKTKMTETDLNSLEITQYHLKIT